MSRFVAMAAGLLALAAPTVVFAQDSSGGTPTTLGGYQPGPPPRNSNWNDPNDYLGAIQREQMDRERSLQATNDRKQALAERVGELVESGQCQAAIDLARSERDRTMARTVERICEPGVGLRPEYQ